MELNITVKTAELITVVTENQANHHAAFEQAWEGYLVLTRAWFEESLRRLKKGKAVDRMSPHPVPQDHSVDYEQVLGMLTMHANDTIELDWMTYRNFVDDEWGWSGQFQTTNTYYASASK